MLRIADRLACTIGLRAANVPMPPTIITEDARSAAAAVRKFGTAVLKPLFSTKARGMRLLDAADEEALVTSLEEFRAEGNPIFYIQKKIEIPGHDLGVVFIGKEYVGTYARHRAAGAWNTTTASGGRYAAYEPSREVLAVAERAAKAFGLDFTGVDVVETSEGPMCFEVSAFGGFRGLREAHGMDPAVRYAEHVLSVLDRR
jgi:ribosomal protein S6--L-glutamate ligase